MGSGAIVWKLIQDTIRVWLSLNVYYPCKQILDKAIRKWQFCVNSLSLCNATHVLNFSFAVKSLNIQPASL